MGQALIIMQQFSEQEMDVFPQGGILPIHSKKKSPKDLKKFEKMTLTTRAMK